MRRARNIRMVYLLLGVIIFPVRDLSAQSPQPGHYVITTDRGIFIAGEEVHFRVFNLNPAAIKEQGWSTVYYMELISPEGISLQRTKWALNTEGASGVLPIPQDLPSGTYYLKGYTRWMKNYGPAGFQYLSMEIINPYRKELLRVDTTLPSKIRLQVRGPCSRAVGPVITLSDRSYSPREQISLELLQPLESTLLDCCISVVRKGAFGKQHEQVTSARYPMAEGVSSLPETRGITLSGSVQQDQSGEPAPFAIVYLSSLGGKNEFYSTYSDENGKFYFALTDGEGEREYFISSSLQERSDLSLLVDQDFSTSPVRLPSLPLQTFRTDPDLVSELSLNAQIREQYQTDHMTDKPDTTGSSSWFYGHPDVIVHFEDYIQLPDMAEYFSEVIPQVSLRRSSGIRAFRVHGNHPDLQYFQPLVMVDGVAVFDVESVLDIPPRAVDRVEILTAPYIRGNVTFGGIVHLITRNGNMGYMDLPASGLLLSYQKFASLSARGLPLEPDGSGIPDVRNTLYWNPSLILTPGQASRLSLHAPETGGTYEIRILGYGPSGQCFEERLTFRVE